MHWDNIYFFQSLGKSPSLKQLLNNKASGYNIDGPQNVSILIDIPNVNEPVMI